MVEWGWKNSIKSQSESSAGTVIKKKPDLFAYGEALIYTRKKEINIRGYRAVIHTAEKKGIRRGIVVYYREMLEEVITIEHKSKKYDIIWLRMKTKKEESLFVFFYAPGEHHDEKCREDFYDELRVKVDEHRKEKIYMMGDSNARLGEFSGDRDIHGKTKNNKNKTLFMGLKQYTGLKLLNRIFEWGKPTYEILGRKRSIIDVGLTNNLRQVISFEVKPHMLGANAQTAHKVIKLTIETKEEVQKCKKEKIKKLRHCSREALIRVRGEVARKCKTLRML